MNCISLYHGRPRCYTALPVHMWNCFMADLGVIPLSRCAHVELFYGRPRCYTALPVHMWNCFMADLGVIPLSRCACTGSMPIIYTGATGRWSSSNGSNIKKYVYNTTLAHTSRCSLLRDVRRVLNIK